MRNSSVIPLLILVPMVLSAQLANAEVFKCTTAEGKTSYSEKPCTLPGAKEMVVPIVVPPKQGATGPVKDWAAENAASNERAKARAAADAAKAAKASASEPKSADAAKPQEQTIAECEANRGANCGSEEEIKQREMDDRTLTPEQVQARQNAVAGRRVREAAEAEALAKEKEKNKDKNKPTDKPKPAVTPVATPAAKPAATPAATPVVTPAKAGK